jgi:putative tryptophan/tyrosine transport system substrate-binding protein
MSKKIFYVSLSAMLFALSFPAQAQEPRKVPRLGLLLVGSATTRPTSNLEVFLKRLHELGYVEGKNIIIERRYAEGKEDRLPDLAADLIRLKVDVIVAGGGNAVRAAKNETKTIPIVMAGVGDAVGTGLVASLARPGGNITGSTGVHTDLSGKRLELLRETIPGITRMAALIYRGNPAYALLLEETETAAKSVRLQLQILEVRDTEKLEKAFEVAKRSRSEAINIVASAFFIAERKKLVELAARSRLPAIYTDRSFVEAGGLMSYGANIADGWRRAATYVDKILKGAQPANLPVEQPMKFELVINLKAAKQIGLTIPPNVLARADRVIR